MTGGADLPRTARGRGLVLIGLRRAGKSTVGRALAAALGRPFCDVDDLVLARTGRTPAAWIRDAGVEAFRDVEVEAVRAAVAAPGAVIAAGGGTPLRAENRERLRAHGVVVYLRTDARTSARRAASDAAPESRPALSGAAAAEEPYLLYVERDDAYRAFADAIVDAAPPVERVVAACLALRGVGTGVD